MKKRTFIAVVTLITATGLISCQKEKTDNDDYLKAILLKGNQQEILKQRAAIENTATNSDAELRTLYDIPISLFAPFEFHEVFCAFPSGNCLPTVIVTASEKVNSTTTTENLKQDYKYEFRSERQANKSKLLSILPQISNYPTLKSLLESEDNVKSKIITDYKTLTKYLKVYTNNNDFEKVIFVTPISVEQISDYEKAQDQ
jgi:hypothetical protein